MERLITYEGATATGPWREVAADILVMPFWTRDFCEEVMAAADLLDEYKPYGPDAQKNAAPGQETRLDRISPRFAENFNAHLFRDVVPVIRKHWWPVSVGKLRMPFVLRYTPETQRSMSPHHDTSLVSFTVRLNDGHEGGCLTFPRQHWDTRDVPVGHIVAFPGRVTHVHWAEPLIAGRRYVLTAWLASRDTPPHDPAVREE